MRCVEMEEMLSAYANDELSPVERQSVERHLHDCADCRKKLEGYLQVRQRLETLKMAPPVPDATELIMSRIKTPGVLQKPWKIWKRLSLALVPSAVILVALLVVQPWANLGDADSVMAQAYSAVSGLQSYRFSISSGSNTQGETARFAAEFVAPDRYHLTEVIDGKGLEFIFIGDEEYFNGGYMSFLTMKSHTNMYSSMITKEATLRWLNLIGNIQKLPDEAVEGVDCLHYEGGWDVEKELRSWQDERARLGLPPFSEGDLPRMREGMHAQMDSVKISLWIGKADHLIRQLVISRQDADATSSVSTTYLFYDFNEPITIDAPVDVEGKLLADWASTSPETLAFSKDVRVDIDDSDAVSRRINYTISMRNISPDTVTGVEVDVLPAFSVSGLWNRWIGGLSTPKPWNIYPGESLDYVITFGYDTAKVPADAVAEALLNSVLYIGYVDSGGHQNVETAHFEVPDGLYTMPANKLPSRDLMPVGEYRINETGASEASGNAAGMIGGNRYLFVLVGTQNSGTTEEPGILVLDVSNPAKPVKVAYVKAPENARYMMNSALSGTDLYVCTGGFMWVVDVSNPASPKDLASLAGTYSGVAVSGNYVYAKDHGTISAIDVSDPRNPKVVSSLDIPSQSSVSLEIIGGFLMAKAGNAFHTIDISSPSSLKIVNSLIVSVPPSADGTPASVTSPTHVLGHAIDGHYAYIALTDETHAGISVMDVSDPVHPREIAFLDLGERGIQGPLFASSGRAYLFARAELQLDPWARLEIIDTADPANPLELGYARLPDYWTFFETVEGGGQVSYSLVDKYLYWFMGYEPNPPVIEIFDLSVP